MDHEGRAMLERMPPEFVRTAAALDEKGQMDFFLREALSFVRLNPGLALRNNLSKWLQFWGGSPRTGAWYPGRWTRWYRIYYLLLLAFAAAGAVSLIKRGQKSGLWLIVLFTLAISVVQSLVFVEGRHRWEVESLLVVVASFGLTGFFRGRPSACP